MPSINIKFIVPFSGRDYNIGFSTENKNVYFCRLNLPPPSTILFIVILSCVKRPQKKNKIKLNIKKTYTVFLSHTRGELQGNCNRGNVPYRKRRVQPKRAGIDLAAATTGPRGG